VNSVKNAIVTMTLLAVGYGAYVVLSNPVPDDLGEMADGSVWQTPDVTTPDTDSNGELAAVSTDGPPPLTGIDVDRTSSPSDVSPPEGTQTSPPEIASPWPAPTTAPPSETEPPRTTSGIPANSANSANDAAVAGSPAAAPTTDPQENFYVSQSGSELSQDDAYPTTSAASMPLHAANAEAPPTATDDGNAEWADPTVSGEAGSPEFETEWQAAQADLRSGQLAAVLGTLSAWYDEPSLSAAQRDRLIPLLDQLAGTVIYSSDSFLEPGHVVQQGETLQDMAQQYHVPVGFLARINGIELPAELVPGETIKVLQGPFRAEVELGPGQITLYLGRYYAGRFPARIGPDLPSATNSYEVASIEPGLEYFDTRSGNRIAPDDPNNPYGSVWISLRGNQITTAHRVGIHVDNGDPKRGCIAVSPTDANDLAAILGPGSAIQVNP
jgi:LysM repeat protein